MVQVQIGKLHEREPMKMPKFSFNIPKVKIYGIDIVKNFLYFFLFIVLSLAAIAFLISPAVHTFKKTKNEYYQTKFDLDNITSEYKRKFRELNTLKNANGKIINAFKRDFDKKNFKMFSSAFMDIKNIKEINSTVYKDYFLKTTYILNATIKSPENFYKLIDALKNYKAVLRIYFPINFVKNKENISLTLKLEHYKLIEAQKADVKAH